LTSAQDNFSYIVWYDWLVCLWNDSLEILTLLEFLNVGSRFSKLKQLLWWNHDEWLSERTDQLSTKNMEVIRRGWTVNNLHVDFLIYVHLCLYGRAVCSITQL
jgi:hypothetical protein